MLNHGSPHRYRKRKKASIKLAAEYSMNVGGAKNL